MPPQILIVEDQAIIAANIKLILQKRGFTECLSVSNGEEALRLVEEWRPDLALMDIQLNSDLDGIQTAHLLQAKFDIPIIYLTSYADDETIASAKTTMPYSYLLKPVQERELLLAIELSLNLHAVKCKLLVSQAQYHALLQTSMDGFWKVDSNSNILEVNDIYCLRMGYTPADLIGQPIALVEVNESPAQIQQHHQAIMETGWDCFETRHRRKDGSIVDFEISVRHVAEQNISYCFLRDITPEKESLERIFQLNQALQQQVNESQALYRAEQEQRQFAERLAEISRTLVVSHNPEEALDCILEQLGDIVQNDVCNLVLIEAGEAHVVRSRGYADFNAGAFIEEFVFPLSGLPIRAEIIRSAQPLLVADVRTDERWRLNAETTWLRSYIAAPIALQNRVIGLINVGNAIPNFYHPVDAQRLQAFAHQAGTAIQNARLFTAAQANARQLEALSERLLNIQETERRHVARELHDEVGQALTAVHLTLKSTLNHPEQQCDANAIMDSMEIVDLALQQVRSISLDLHPALLDDLGLVPALRWYADREARVCEFEAQVIADSEMKRLPGQLELVCYRVAQEALTNIARHAGASHVKVELWQRGHEMHLVISDDGVGFDVSETLARCVHGESLGLLGMQERVNLMHGTLEINSEPGSGTEIHVRLPLTPPAGKETSPDNAFITNSH